jgi:rhamnulokinase
VTPERFLAFDLGAESGRAVVGTLCDGALTTEEIHRFPNRPVRVLGTLYWDALALYGNLIEGMRIYGRQYGRNVASIGIDTWGVDFALLARDGSLLQNPVCYRDRRTEGILAEVERRVRALDLFRTTGMTISPIQSLCQLAAMRRAGSPALEEAATFLMMPDLFGYFLTGVKACERTNAVNTQFYDLERGSWAEEVLRAFDLRRAMLPELRDPGTVLGELLPSIAAEAGLEACPVVSVCTHDTGSAVAAVPGDERDGAFLSSGTWSVVGARTERVVTTEAAFGQGFCNELTLGGTFLCKNIMGLWLLEEARREWAAGGVDWPYQQLLEAAECVPKGGPVIDPEDGVFLSPASMTGAIEEYCRRTGQRAPRGPAETARAIFESLAQCYGRALKNLETVLGRRFAALDVVGGGAHNVLLCQLTADATGIPVLAGPAEATATGNLLAQAAALGHTARQAAVRTEYQPRV